MQIARDNITGGILAGGAGRRLGGLDKGWYEVAGKPLVVHTLERLGPQCDRILISANRSLARYRALGYPVCVDDSGGDFRGPLAGTAALLRAAVTPYVLTVPVDTPLLPRDLATRLAAAMGTHTEIAVARYGDQVQRLHALIRRDLLKDLQAALLAGTRAVHDWHARHELVTVEWLQPECFANINSPEDAGALAGCLPRSVRQ